MSFLCDGITNVRALTLPDGIGADGGCAAFSCTALVTWRSLHAGMLHQVYLNGRYAGTTLDPDQSRLIVQAPGSFHSAVRVEVVAVEPKDAYADFACDLENPGVGNGRVRLTLVRSQGLPFGATAGIYFDNGTGRIDYTSPLSSSPLPLWPCPQDKAGFGMAQFGMGDFGYDSAASVGFGRGHFGYGQFGLDADIVEWVSPPLPLGTYRFGVTITDPRGNESPASETLAVAVIPAAQPATSLDIATFDQQTNQLVLSVSDGI